MKLNWRRNGRPLAHPLVILRRLAALPFLLAGHALTILAVLAGWGVEDAKYAARTSWPL